MERPSRGRAHTFTGVVSSIFSPFKPTPSPPPVTNETVGWRPSTLQRSDSELSERHVLSCKPSLPANPAPALLKRQLTSADTAAPMDIPKMTVAEVTTTPGALSYTSSGSSQRVAFMPQLLKPAGTSSSGQKLRQRAPSPYPDGKKPAPPTKTKEVVVQEPQIRSRGRTLTMERIDGVQFSMPLTQYLEAHPDALPPAGSTPVSVGHYWQVQQRRHSADSDLSNPEADDEASDDDDADVESTTTYSSEDDDDDDASRWECETAYEEQIDDTDSPASIQQEPARLRPPPLRHANTWPQPVTPSLDTQARLLSDTLLEPPAHHLSDDLLEPSSFRLPSPFAASDTSLVCSPSNAPALSFCTPSETSDQTPFYSPSSWLPMDPSYLSDSIPSFPVPPLLWSRKISPSGIWYLSSTRPPRGITAGGPEGGPGGGGPSHTPSRDYKVVRDPRFGPVDAKELRGLLKEVQAERQKFDRGTTSGVSSAYDEGQHRIRARYECWEGGVTQGQWTSSAGHTATTFGPRRTNLDIELAAATAAAAEKRKRQQHRDRGRIPSVHEHWAATLDSDSSLPTSTPNANPSPLPSSPSNLSPSSSAAPSSSESFPSYSTAEDYFSLARDTEVSLPNYPVGLPSPSPWSALPPPRANRKTSYPNPILPKSLAHHRRKAASLLEGSSPAADNLAAWAGRRTLPEWGPYTERGVGVGCSGEGKLGDREWGGGMAMVAASTVFEVEA